MRKLRTILNEARAEIVGGLIVAAAIALLNTFFSSSQWRILLVIMVLGAWLICAYVFFKHADSRILVSSRGTSPSTRVYKSNVRKFSALSRRLALAGLIAFPLLGITTWGYQLYEERQIHTQVFIIVADFDGPETKNYRVTESIWEHLNLALSKYDNVKIKRLEEVFQTSFEARSVGSNHNADVVIWGWYGVTDEVVPLSVHFEVLHPLEPLPDFDSELYGDVRMAPVEELESFSLQTRLSSEMAFLSLFTVGIVRYSGHDWNGAVELFTDVLAQSSESITVLDTNLIYLFRGSAYLNIGKYTSAIADFDRFMEDHPEASQVYLLRGVAYHFNGDYESAIIDYNEAVKLDPNLVDAYNNRAVSLAAVGQNVQAIADATKVIDLRPDAGAYYNRGVHYRGHGELDNAIADYTKSIELWPRDSKVYYNRGQAYLAKEEIDLAFADYTKAIRLKPDYAKAFAQRAFTHFLSGRYHQAIADYSRAIELNTPDLDLPSAYERRADTYYFLGKFDRALEDISVAIQLRPDAEMYNKRGNIYLKKRMYELAIADYTKAVALESTSDSYYKNRANVYFLVKKEYDVAIRDYNRAIELNPSRAELYYLRGAVYLAKENYGYALEDLSHALELDPDYPAAYYLRATVYGLQGEHEQAVVDFNRAIELAPDNPEYYYNRATTYIAIGEREKAIADYRKVLKFSDDSDERELAEAMLQELGAKQGFWCNFLNC